MPELPEVETIKNDLQKSLPGLQITDIDVIDPRILKACHQPDLTVALRGKTIQAVSRRAKMIVMAFKEGGFLCAHMKMTGQLIYGKRLDQKETKLIFKLSNRMFLNYNDQRLFGRLFYLSTLDKDAYLSTLGPEPLQNGFTARWLAEAVKRHRIPIKTLLLNQRFIAGIGNIYASEILFDAKINPQKKARRLSKVEVDSLALSVRRVLSEAIKYRGTSMRNYRDPNGQKGRFIERLKVYNREHQQCPVCRNSIRRIVQSGRSTFFCQHCQR
jgi:formamidopyrimidine-DNA glycosylase